MTSARMASDEWQAVSVRPAGTGARGGQDSVRAHLVADVPVSVFLSGGIDSAAIAGLAAELGAHVEGITIGFDEFAGRHDDEVPVAAAIAAHYGLPHHVRMVSRAEFEQDIPRILRCHGSAVHRRRQHLVREQGGGRARLQGGAVGYRWRRAFLRLFIVSTDPARGGAGAGACFHPRRSGPVGGALRAYLAKMPLAA